MTKVICYQTSSEDLAKTCCLITEKCYYSNLKSLVIIENQDYISIFDKALWTYSKKHFIPHATIDDPLPEEQPVLISNRLENKNNAQALIVINTSRESILEILSYIKNQLEEQPELSIERLILINDEFAKIGLSQLANLIETSPVLVNSTEFFSKSRGKWQKIDVNGIDVNGVDN